MHPAQATDAGESVSRFETRGDALLLNDGRQTRPLLGIVVVRAIERTLGLARPFVLRRSAGGAHDHLLSLLSLLLLLLLLLRSRRRRAAADLHRARVDRSGRSIRHGWRKIRGRVHRDGCPRAVAGAGLRLIREERVLPFGCLHLERRRPRGGVTVPSTVPSALPSAVRAAVSRLKCDERPTNRAPG